MRLLFYGNMNYIISSEYIKNIIMAFFKGSFFCFSFFVFGLLTSYGQDCNCDHTIDTRNSTSVNIIRASNYTYSAGDVFCVMGGKTAGLRFIDFSGTESDPLIFINCGGQVIINENKYSGIAFQGSQYIHLTGTGSSDEYGFSIESSGPGGGMGVNVGSLSSDFEIDHIEVANTGFAGIMAKTDPYCDNPATWRRNGFVLRNLEIHHNYIHETEGEGMYIGYTGGYVVTSNRSCTGEGYIFGHLLENVNIHHNRLENTGWDGIQVNLTTKGAHIHHNEIIGYGTAEETYQNSGMSLGASDLKVYNNLIQQNFESSIDDNGMVVIGALSGSQFYNNVVVACSGTGIYAHNRYAFEDLNKGYYFMHNTFVETGKAGIFYNGRITQDEDPIKVGDEQLSADVRFYNNLVINPGIDYTEMNFWKKNNESFIDFNTKNIRDAVIQKGNYFTRDLSSLHLKDNYDISSDESPLIDVGIRIPEYEPVFDYNDNNRVMGNSSDAGAFEWDIVNALTFDKSINETSLYPNPGSEMLSVGTSKEVKHVIITNNVGQTVISTQKSSLINISGLSKGVYSVEVKFSTGEKEILNYLKW